MQEFLWRLFRLIARALIVGEVGYLVVANGFLYFGGIQRALQETDEIRATIGSSWTLLPGRVHFRDVRILFHDHNWEWSLDAKSLETDVAFLPFLYKTVNATRVRGEGLVFRVRGRVPPADAMLPTTRELPPIPEFETPALFYPYLAPAPRTDLWTIHAENVDVGVVEVWGQQFRYVGAGRARGAFRLHAGYHLWVGPASLELEPGELLVGHRLLSPRFGGHVGCVVHPLFVNSPVGREVLRYISAGVDLHGEDVRLASMELFMPPGTTLGSPGARLDVVVGTDHGVVTQVSHAELRGPALVVGYRSWAFRSGPFALVGRGSVDGTGEAMLRVEQGRASGNEVEGLSQQSCAHGVKLCRAAPPPACADVFCRAGSDQRERSGGSPSLGRGPAPLALAAGQLGIASTSLDMTASWGLRRMDIALSSLGIPELVALDELANPYGVRLEGGSGSLDLSMRYFAKAVSGEGRAEIANARGRVRALRWELDGATHLSLRRLESVALSDGGLDLEFLGRLAVSASSTRLEASAAHITARTRMSEASGSGFIRATAGEVSLRRGALRVASPAVADVELSRLDLSRGTVQASGTGQLAAVAATSGKAARAHSGTVRLRSEVSLEESVISQGWLEVSVPALSLRAGDTEVTANATARFAADALDVSRRRGRASAVFVVRDLSAVDAVGGPSCQRTRVPKAAVHAKLWFSPEGQPSVSVSGALERARTRWGDFTASGSPRFEISSSKESSESFAIHVRTGPLRLKSGTTQLEGWEANVPELRAASTLRIHPGRLSGPIRVWASQVVGRIGATPVSASLNAEGKLAVLDLKRSEGIGSGSVRIDHAAIGAGGARVDDWWGQVEIPMVRWATGESVGLSGDFRARFRDGLPALGMFVTSKALPDWVPKVLPLHELEAHGRFRRSCRVTDIIFQEASGGPLVAAGRIQSTPGNTRGAFLVQLNSPVRVSTGLVAYGDGVGVAVLAGNDWLREQSKTMDGWAGVVSCAKPASRCE